MILLREVDSPKTLGEKITEYLAKPPQPILRFYGDFSTEVTDDKKHLHFAVRNGTPLPLLYGIYVRAYDSFTSYIEKTDHIGPFSTDNWRLTIDNIQPMVVEIRLGLVPLEILLDKIKVTV